MEDYLNKITSIIHDAENKLDIDEYSDLLLELSEAIEMMMYE